jgi:Xaa-Pro dipeptidase
VAVAIDVATQQSTLFIPELPPEYATIMGRIKTLEEWKHHYLVDCVKYVDDAIRTLESMLRDRSTILVMQGQNSDSGNSYHAPAIVTAHFEPSLVDATTLFPILAECRVVKSEAELLLLRHVTEVTSLAHAYTMQHIKPKMMEYQAESLFRHYCYFHYGCRLVGYTPICGCGPNSAILHYGHAGEPNARQIQPGDMCLFDMGAEYFGYGSDVTCSFPINGVFETEAQRTIYASVLNAQVAVYDMIKPGVAWVDCHKRAEECILQGLADIGVVVPGDKTIQELVEMRLGAVFMPHGLGHLIGIDTHDVGGYLDGHPPRPVEAGLVKLRTSRILSPNMTLTVEPGCYFIDHLLDEAMRDDSVLRSYLNADVVDVLRGFGGVRLEDVVVVTKDSCVNFTLCPRTIAEVEAVMAGAKWPPIQDEAPELRRERLTCSSQLITPSSL